ncbi:MAG: hypothetical protein AB1657_00105 [Candidatus Micrarchaeota archaeon]
MKSILALFLATLLLFGCTQQPGSQPPVSGSQNGASGTQQPAPGSQPSSGGGTQTPSTISPPAPQFLKGVSLSPRSFSSSDFTDFFSKAQEAGDAVMWAGDWNELSNTQGGGPVVIASLSSQYNYVPVIEAQFFTQSAGQLVRPLDEANRRAYKDAAVAFAEEYKPEYLGLGIEVNILYEKSPSDFDSFVSLYDETYDAVKAVSPNTKIFTVFQLEKMKGLDGGLFGGENNPADAQWELLSRFPKSDLIAFTTYPDLIYKNPSEIPSDYYSEIPTHTDKPIAFTEIGWHSAASPAGWESSEDEQAEFVTRFFDLTSGLDMKLAVWSFLYGQDTVEPFNSMGLLRGDGTSRPAWDAWRAG